MVCWFCPNRTMYDLFVADQMKSFMRFYLKREARGRAIFMHTPGLKPGYGEVYSATASLRMSTILKKSDDVGRDSSFE